MTWVKICGITNLEDALTAADAGADALGFVFYEKSPRYVDPGTAAAIAQQVRDKIEKVGVFVDPPQNGLAEIANGVGLTMLQCRVGSKPGAESKAAFQQPVRMLFQWEDCWLMKNAFMDLLLNSCVCRNRQNVQADSILSCWTHRLPISQAARAGHLIGND